MNDSRFKLNPIVTLQHCYWQPPVGKSLWRKRAKDGPLVGIKAKTLYPKRPDAWPDDDWTPDTILQLIQAGMMQGKSVGFLRLKSHSPSSHEIAADPAMAQVSRVIDEWLLIEYACTFLSMNQAALVEAVSKSGLAPDRLNDLITPAARLARAVCSALTSVLGAQAIRHGGLTRVRPARVTRPPTQTSLGAPVAPPGRCGPARHVTPPH
jgi:hypothetical protein